MQAEMPGRYERMACPRYPHAMATTSTSPAWHGRCRDTLWRFGSPLSTLARSHRLQDANGRLVCVCVRACACVCVCTAPVAWTRSHNAAGGRQASPSRLVTAAASLRNPPRSRPVARRPFLLRLHRPKFQQRQVAFVTGTVRVVVRTRVRCTSTCAANGRAPHPQGPLRRPA